MQYNGRNILLNVNHIGINHENVPHVLAQKGFLKFKEKLVQETQFKKVVIASVDRLHPISGITAKLEGYKHFLRNNAPYSHSVCLIQFVPVTGHLNITDINKVSPRPGNDEIPENENQSSYAKRLTGNKRKSRWVTNLTKKTLGDIEKLVNEIQEEFGPGCLIFKQ